MLKQNYLVLIKKQCMYKNKNNTDCVLLLGVSAEESE